jgi:hypothetical protein
MQSSCYDVGSEKGIANELQERNLLVGELHELPWRAVLQTLSYSAVVWSAEQEHQAIICVSVVATANAVHGHSTWTTTNNK